MNRPTAPAAVPALHRRVPQHLARRFWQICSTLLSEACAPHELMPWHVALLSQLRDTPGRDRTWFAARIGADASSTGQALDRFATRGLVRREINPMDRRAVAYTLTPKGEAFAQEIVNLSRGVATRLLAPLTTEEADTLLNLLARLVDAHEAHAKPGAGRRPPSRGWRKSAVPHNNKPQGENTT